MQEAQRTTIAGRTDQGALRTLLLAVLAVALVEAVVIGYLLIGRTDTGDVTTTLAATDLEPVDAWAIGFRAGERATLSSTLAADPSSDGWAITFRASERDASSTPVIDRVGWAIGFRASERTGG